MATLEKAKQLPKSLIENARFALSKKFRKNYRFLKCASPGILKKDYKTYAEYLKCQKEKLGLIRDSTLRKHNIEYRAELKARLAEQGLVKPGMSVLCLGARTGAEVQSFIDLGCFAVGVDLNPGKGNKHVLQGDFNYLQFADNSTDVVFSNSFDHAFDTDRFIGEAKRVLKPGGLFVLEIIPGIEEGRAFGHYESITWGRVEDALNLFKSAGFEIVEKSEFECPKKGTHVSMRARSPQLNIP